MGRAQQVADQPITLQAARRLVLSLALLVLLIAVATAQIYGVTLGKAATARADSMAGFYQARLLQFERDWELQSQAFKVRIEVSRLLEEQPPNVHKLQAHMTVQGINRSFQYMLIQDPEGKRMFSFGTDLDLATVPLDRSETSGWYLDGASGSLFRIFAQKVWLGDREGRMATFYRLDNGILKQLATPGIELAVFHGDTPVASSEGQAGIDAMSRTAVPAGNEQREIAWSGGTSDATRLRINAPVKALFTPTELVLAGSLIPIFDGAILWFTLGTWLMRNARRIRNLGSAVEEFHGRHHITGRMKQELGEARSSQHDEIHAVAVAVHEMAAQTVERELQHLADRERLLLADKVFANSDEAILITDADAKIVSVNPAFTAITGYLPEEVIGEDPRIFASGRHDAAFHEAMWAELKGHGAWSGEVWDRRKNGEVFPKWLSINAVQDPETGQITHYVAIFSDITERKKNEARIEHLAYHDALTGLPNRFSLLARLAQSLAYARRDGHQLALMFIDLDRFKMINDSLGHDVGDQLLVAVSRRIRAALRETDTVARLGGDEFVIVLPGITAPEDAARVAEKVIEHVGAPLALAGHTLHTSPSIGIGLFPGDGQEADTLMKNADIAMYHAKQNGRNSYRFFSVDMNEAATERLLMETQLRAAFDNRELTLAYQPQVDLATGAVVGMEALLRWDHAERGSVPPATFIPIAEETGLMVPIGAWVLEEACRQAKALSETGALPVRVSVNLSARQFRQQNLVQQIEQTLARTGLPPGRLELEITESIVMENAQHAIEVLRALRNDGVLIAIDDFGTGYSSLAYLKRLPIGRVKIDRSFVMELDRDTNDAAIARGIVALAQSLGIAVTAEGIETAAQLAMLKEFGCTEGQGYLFSRPLPVAELAAFLQLPRPAQETASPFPRLH